MNAIKEYLPSSIDFRCPESWIGADLEGEDKSAFESCKALVDRFYFTAVNPSLLLEISDSFALVGCKTNVMTIFDELLKYIRLKFLSDEPLVIEKTVILLDFLMKNCNYKVHLIISRERFLKTMTIVGRRQLKKATTADNLRAANAVFDAIQAWGEAFLERQDLYPNFWRAYENLRVKHQIKFPRPDFDPTRVPIILGPLTAKEETYARYYRSKWAASESKDEYEEVDHREQRNKSVSVGRQFANSTTTPHRSQQHYGYAQLEDEWNSLGFNDLSAGSKSFDWEERREESKTEHGTLIEEKVGHRGPTKTAVTPSLGLNPNDPSATSPFAPSSHTVVVDLMNDEPHIATQPAAQIIDPFTDPFDKSSVHFSADPGFMQDDFNLPLRPPPPPPQISQREEYGMLVPYDQFSLPPLQSDLHVLQRQSLVTQPDSRSIVTVPGWFNSGSGSNYPPQTMTVATPTLHHAYNSPSYGSADYLQQPAGMSQALVASRNYSNAQYQLQFAPAGQHCSGWQSSPMSSTSLSGSQMARDVGHGSGQPQFMPANARGFVNSNQQGANSLLNEPLSVLDLIKELPHSATPASPSATRLGDVAKHYTSPLVVSNDQGHMPAATTVDQEVHHLPAGNSRKLSTFHHCEGGDPSDQFVFVERSLESLSEGSGVSQNYDWKPSLPAARAEQRGPTFIAPSSDPSVEVRYFGHQRVVVQKKKL